MSPRLLMFIRHAEEPDHEGGIPESRDLSPIGSERARAYVDFFGHPTAPIEKPDAIVAAAADDHSQRSVETVTPLARALWPDANERETKFITNVAKLEFKTAVGTIMGLSGVVLVCWEHKALPSLIASLPIPPITPSHWSGHRFDVVWMLWPRNRGGWHFAQVPELLLRDDKDKPIKDTDEI